MKDEKEIERNRRDYCKPKIEQVQLMLEEAVLETCKSGHQAGPFKKNCAPGQGCPKQSPS